MKETFAVSKEKKRVYNLDNILICLFFRIDVVNEAVFEEGKAIETIGCGISMLTYLPIRS